MRFVCAQGEWRACQIGTTLMTSFKGPTSKYRHTGRWTGFNTWIWGDTLCVTNFSRRLCLILLNFRCKQRSLWSTPSSLPSKPPLASGPMWQDQRVKKLSPQRGRRNIHQDPFQDLVCTFDAFPWPCKPGQLVGSPSTDGEKQIAVRPS